MEEYFAIRKFKIKYSTLFFIILIAVSFYYNYNKILFLRPVGIHQWRNCICANYALNYYYGADFYKPQTGCFIANEYTSDINVLEFPIFYYIVSLVYRIFGYHEFLYRLLNVIIGFLGLFALFKLTRRFLQDQFFAFIIPVLIFTSTIYAYYLNNFIIDTTALSLGFIGFYYFYSFIINRKFKFFIVMAIMFLIGGLMKPTSLIMYFSILMILGLELLFRKQFKFSNKMLIKPLWQFFILIFVLLIIIAWFFYARYSGIKMGVIYPRIFPLWNIDAETKYYIWNQFIARFKMGWYHSPIFIYVTAGVVIFNIIFINKFHKLLTIFVFLLLLQIITLNILYFNSIGRCDYYQINNLIIIPVIYLNLAYYFKKNYPKIFKSITFKIIVFTVTLLLINDCRLGMKSKFSDWHYTHSKAFFVDRLDNITPYLRKLGIKREDRVYFTPDRSMNISLYLMDQKGNTDFKIEGSTKEKITLLKSKGLKYIFVGDHSIYREDLGDYIDNLIGVQWNKDI